ncbi:MAG: ABC transporter ATP-binding protein, partial [Lachnospiraceae bacterium]|nr:ABC transporter ATP-binding protein [Lachnospiraceae bacterium]
MQTRKKLSTYIWEYKWYYFFAILSLIASVSLDMLAPMLTMHIIDDVILGGRLTILPYLLGGILLVGVGRCVLQYTKEFIFDKMGSSIGSDMRKNLFDHIQGLSSSFFDKTNTGELMARVKDDIDRIWNTLSYVSMLIIEVIFHTCVVLFCMYRLHAPLAVIPTVAMVLSAFIAISMERHLGSIYEDISEENAVLNTVAEENLAGVRTVKAFAREKFEISKFLSHNQRYYELNMKQSKVFVRYYPYLQIITKLLPMLILLLGGRLVIQGVITLGVLGAFLEYSNNIVWPMEMLGWLSNDFSAGIASNKKLSKIYDQTPTVTETEKPVSLDHV